MAKKPAEDLAKLDVSNTNITTPAEKAVRDGDQHGPVQGKESRRGRPAKGRSVQTTLRLTPEAWASLQQRAVTESIQTGRKRHISDIVSDALEEYYQNNPAQS